MRLRSGFLFLRNDESQDAYRAKESFRTIPESLIPDTEGSLIPDTEGVFQSVLRKASSQEQQIDLAN